MLAVIGTVLAAQRLAPPGRGWPGYVPLSQLLAGEAVAPGRGPAGLDLFPWNPGQARQDRLLAGSPADVAECPPECDRRGQEADAAKAIADATDDRTRAAASYRMSSVAEVRRFIREVLGLLRAEMRNRGMLLPDLPPDIDLENGPEAAGADPGEDS